MLLSLSRLLGAVTLICVSVTISFAHHCFYISSGNNTRERGCNVVVLL